MCVGSLERRQQRWVCVYHAATPPRDEVPEGTRGSASRGSDGGASVMTIWGQTGLGMHACMQACRHAGRVGETGQVESVSQVEVVRFASSAAQGRQYPSRLARPVNCVRQGAQPARSEPGRDRIEGASEGLAWATEDARIQAEYVCGGGEEIVAGQHDRSYGERIRMKPARQMRLICSASRTP